MQKISIGEFLKSAFSYWAKTILYQAIYSIIYFAVFYSTVYVFANKYGFLLLIEKFPKIKPGDISAIQKLMAEVANAPGLTNFSIAILGTLCFLFPLCIGFFQIFRKIDLGQKPQFSDLFCGYNGSAFFKYISFYLFWIMIFIQCFRLPFLPVVWIAVTLFSAPLMFFMNRPILEGISLTIKSLRIYFIEISVCCFIAFALRYFGFFTVFAAPILFPFWYAVIYALYTKIFVEKK